LSPQPKLTFKVGHILRVKVEIPNRPVKVCVCVSIVPNLNFYINSENRNYSDSIDFKCKQPRRDYPYNDSYLSLAKAYDHSSKEITKNYGPIDLDECDLIIERVKSSETLTEIEIQQIIASLEAFKMKN
jgi:hypothetical protein